VLDLGQPRDENRQPQPGGTTQAVVQPDRVRFEVGRDPFPRRGQGPRHARGLAAKPPFLPAPSFRGRGQLGVARDERDRVAQLLRAKGGVKRGDELADLLPARSRAARRSLGRDRRVGHYVLLHFGARSSQFGQRGVELIAAAAPGVQEIRGTVESGGRGLSDPQRRAVDAVAVEPWLNDNAVQPVQLVDQAHGRPGGSAQPGRAVGRGQEGTPQRLDCLVRLRSRVIAVPRKLFVHAAEQVRDPRVQPGGQRPAGGGRGITQPVACWRGPQKRDPHQRGASGHRPAGQPVGHGRCRRGQRDRQDERQQQRRARPGQHRADHAGKDHAEPHHRHRNGREPRGLRGQRGQADEHSAGDG